MHLQVCCRVYAMPMKSRCIYKNSLTLIWIQTMLDQLNANKTLLNWNSRRQIHCAASSLLNLCKDSPPSNFKSMLKVPEKKSQFPFTCVLQKSLETVLLIHKPCFRIGPPQIAIINLCALPFMIRKGNF